MLALGLGELAILGLVLQLLSGATKELAPALSGPQLLGQLITTTLAVELVLDLIGGFGLGQDLPGDLLEAVIDLRAGIAGDPGAVDRYDTRLVTSPAFAQSFNTSLNSSASARW